MALVLLRCAFLMVAIALGCQLVNSTMVVGIAGGALWLGLLVGLGTGLSVVAADLSMKRTRLDTMTGVYFGLIIGVVVTYVLFLALTPSLAKFNPEFADWLRLGMATILC